MRISQVCVVKVGKMAKYGYKGTAPKELLRQGHGGLCRHEEEVWIDDKGM